MSKKTLMQSTKRKPHIPNLKAQSSTLTVGERSSRDIIWRGDERPSAVVWQGADRSSYRRFLPVKLFLMISPPIDVSRPPFTEGLIPNVLF